MIGVKVFNTGEEWQKDDLLRKQQKANEREYAKNNRSEKKHFVFHGNCLGCVTPLHYGLGNCLGCRWYDFIGAGSIGVPDLGIRNILQKTDGTIW